MVLQLHDYPRMERQDLSQSQLQAFKFTPVDDPGLESRHSAAALQPVSPNQFVNGGWKDHALNGGSDFSSLNDSFEFANTTMPSLNDTSVGYGFTPVQCSLGAVSDSPKKKYIRDSAQRIMQQSAKAFLNGGGPVAYGVDPMPSARPNTSSGAFSAHNFDNSAYGHNSSLFQALKSEQEAHYQSKLALDAEKVQRLEAEAEVKNLVEHNKSLLNSIRLLQSTVKHMVTKDQEGTKNQEKIHIQTAHTESKESQAKEKSTSILYDSLSQQRRQAEQQRQNDSTEVSVASLADIELPGKFPSVEKARAFHKQPVSSTIVVASPESPGCRSPVDYGENVIQPQRVLNAENIAQVQLQQSSLANASQTHLVVNGSGQVHGDTPAPMLQLPASFLAKYGGPRCMSSSHSVSSDSDQSDVPSQTTNLAVLQGYKGVSATVTPSRNMPSADHLDWKLRQDELDDFLNAPRYTWPNSKESWYFKYPLRYLPRITEKDVYRTVMIDFIPHGTTYSNVLAQIRGGVLESVQMYGVGKGSSEFICARIVFTHEASAAELHERGQRLGIFMNGHRVRVWQVSEPTYPRSQSLADLIYKEGYTRLLIVDAALVDMEHVLRLKLRHQISGGFVLDISSTQDGMTLVEFTSIAEAEKALRLLIADPDLDETQFDFEPDYCARPYDEV